MLRCCRFVCEFQRGWFVDCGWYDLCTSAVVRRSAQLLRIPAGPQPHCLTKPWPLQLVSCVCNWRRLPLLILNFLQPVLGVSITGTHTHAESRLLPVESHRSQCQSIDVATANCATIYIITGAVTRNKRAIVLKSSSRCG